MTEVYLACTNALEDPARYEKLLSCVNEERRVRITRLRLPADRRRSLCAQLLLEHALRVHGVKELSFAYGEKGKPSLSEASGLYFNLSHAGEYAVCAISDAEIGCDIEQIKPEINLAIADRFFCSSEAAWIREAEAEERVERFFRLWTLKESLMKATGLGFSLMPSAFSFAMEEGGVRLATVPSESLLPCSFSELAPIDGYRLALCLRKRSFEYEPRLIPVDLETLC